MTYFFSFAHFLIEYKTDSISGDLYSHAICFSFCFIEDFFITINPGENIFKKFEVSFNQFVWRSYLTAIQFWVARMRCIFHIDC